MSDTQPIHPPRQTSDEWAVLDLLLDDDTQRPWAVEEVVREIGSAVVVADAIASRRGAGLVHHASDGFVFATRAATRFHDLSA